MLQLILLTLSMLQAPSPPSPSELHEAVAAMLYVDFPAVEWTLDGLRLVQWEGAVPLPTALQIATRVCDGDPLDCTAADIAEQIVVVSDQVPPEPGDGGGIPALSDIRDAEAAWVGAAP